MQVARRGIYKIGERDQLGWGVGVLSRSIAECSAVHYMSRHQLNSVASAARFQARLHEHISHPTSQVQKQGVFVEMCSSNDIRDYLQFLTACASLEATMQESRRFVLGWRYRTDNLYREFFRFDDLKAFLYCVELCAIRPVLLRVPEPLSPAAPSARKRNLCNPPANVTAQTGFYAAEMFAANDAVNNLLDIVVVRYHDRQGISQCSGIDFIDDLPRFIVLFYAFQRFKLEDWGRNKHFKEVEKEALQKLKIGDVDLVLHTSDEDRDEYLTKKSKKFPGVQEDWIVVKIFLVEEQQISV
ncbi:uncharacterized protein EDB91DRAFT_1339674 [Suillus paluster]|uniref:uncharacterized protein n=1 Tax=Suillus paluster TaxID=48578 RepID=UPI001B880CE5|nr:uncharacterized protein EDB91DRAFT_1339674 [Suillus paluster]KAG1726191.1 hypothetical protein EDB91DRAFT_1339674 [Suillus paluster]